MREPLERTAPVVAYLTDVEGMWSRIESFCDGNPHVSLDEQGRLSVREDAVFVFGGDAIDRGPSGRRVIATLLDAKRRQPDRVVFLAGNRDINKLRLVRELGGTPLPQAPAAVRKNRAELLRWIFASTMGARGAFEFRRAELAREGGKATDEDVVESYLFDLSDAGPLREYLSHCQLTYRAASTLFVHGGLTLQSLGHVPTVGSFPNVDAWTEALNRWYRAQFAAFANNAVDRRGEPLWGPLIAYQAPVPGTRVNRGSVVYGRTADEHNNPVLPERAVIARLREAGVLRLVVGHTPNGDSPSIVRVRDFELVVGDNSYARVDIASQLVLRPDALSIAGCTELDDGGREAVRVALTRGDAESPIGMRTADTGHLVKGELSSGDYLLFRYGSGFRVEQVAVSRKQLSARALVAPHADAGDT